MRRVLFILLWLPCLVLAQSTLTWDEFMQQMAEEGIDEADEQEWEAQMGFLSELHERPLDLNQATREQLLQFPFMSVAAVEGILEYIALNGPMRSLGELRLVNHLSLREQEWLRFFVTVSPLETPQSTDTTHRWWGRSRHELVTRVDIPCYNREGWSWSRGIAHNLRYTWQQGRHLDVGLRLEKDAGEQLFTRDAPFWDSYGGHVTLKEIGPVRQIIVGDFKAGFGEGLVLNNGFRFGKTSMSLWRTTNGLRPHRTTDEVNFLRGVAGTLAFGREWSLTALYSIRSLDATVNKDNSVSSINTSGLHRTDSERARKGTLGSQTTALHLAKTFHLRSTSVSPSSLSVGATGMFQYYDHQFRQSAALYRQIYPIGYLFGAVSANYGFQSSHLMVNGETARSFDQRGGGWATLNKAAWRFSPQTQLAVIQRFYSKDYYSPHASAFSENSRVQNESGVAVQFDAERLGPFALRAFFDYFYSPWPRYTMSRYSSGWEGLLQTSWQPRKGRQLVLRYRVKSKEQSDRRHYSHQLRASYYHRLSSLWDAQLSAFLHRYHQPAQGEASSGSSTGFAVMPQVSCHTRDERLRWSLTAVWFHTDGYDSRLYLYEPSLFQTFGMQQLYGHGQRLATTLRYSTANRRWSAQIKAGVTHYTDRDEISSGPLRIGSSWKTDVQVLLRMLLK